jgi:hypothetical protein
MGEFYKTCKEKMIPTLYNFFQKLKKANSELFFEAGINLILKPNKGIVRLKTYR